MSISEAIEYFMIYLNLKGSTETTLKVYRTFLFNFSDYLEVQGITNISDLSIQHINKYHMYLRGKENENSPGKKLKLLSIRTYLRHIKAFLNYLYKEEVLTIDIASKMVLPKAEKPTVEILTDEEIKALLTSFNLKTELGSRNHAIVYLMLDSGLRVSDICNLKLPDINFTTGYIFIPDGKGHKSRIVPIGFKCRKAVSDYLYKRRLPIDVNSDYLFLSKHRKQLNRDMVSSIFHNLQTKTGIVRLHAHLLRHTYATNFLLNEMGDIFELSQILGHEDIKTTQIYLHIAGYYKSVKKVRKSTYLDKF